MEKRITVDTRKDGFPKLIDRVNSQEENEAFLKVEVQLEDGGDIYKGKVITISSNGKYVVKLDK